MRAEIDSELTEVMGAKLDEIVERAKEPLPYFKVQAQLLDGLIQDSFMESQNPFGDPFTKLSDTTEELRRKGEGDASNKPLIDTGNLRQSTFVQPVDNTIEFGVSGSAAEYAGTHLFGKDKNNRGFFYRKAHKRTSPSGKRHNVKGHAVKGKPFGGALVPRRRFLPIEGTGPGDARPDFSKGPALEWWEAFLVGVKKFLASGEGADG